MSTNRSLPSRKSLRPDAGRIDVTAHARRWPWCLAVFLLWAAPAFAGTGTFTAGAPKHDGVLVVKVLVGRNKTCEAKVKITGTMTAAQKADAIRAALKTKCTEVTVTGTGSDVICTSDASGAVSFDETGQDTTGEVDTFPKLKGKQLCVLEGSAAGISWDDVSAGTVTVGTTDYVATVPTSPGESPFTVFGAAVAQLNAHGIANVSIVPLGNSQAGLLFDMTGVDAAITWGCDDRGVSTQFRILEDSTEVDTNDGEFFVPPGVMRFKLLLAQQPVHSHTELGLYGYDPSASALIEHAYWSAGDQPAQYNVNVSPQIVHYRLQLTGTYSPSGLVVYPGMPAGQTPSTPLFVPGFSLGWADGLSTEFNPTLGQGGGTPFPVTLQPGLSLNNVPAAIGAGHWQYLPLQLNVQPDPSRPWLYVGGNPAQGFAEHTWVTLQLTGLFDAFGNPVPQLPLMIGVSQGATQLSFPITATVDANGIVEVPPVDLGALLAQPFTLYVGVGGPMAGMMSDAAATTTATGFMTLDAIVVSTGSQPATAAVTDRSGGRADGLSFSAPSPSPCLATTRLHFSLSRASRVSLQVLDAAGRVVRTLTNDAMGAGSHDVSWNLRDDSARRVAGGIYFARLESDGATQSRKIAVIR